MNDKTKETKETPLVQQAPLMKEPRLPALVELIKVRTISPKIVEQLDRLDACNDKVDMSDMSIIGEVGFFVIVQKANGHLAKVHQSTYFDHLVACGLSFDGAREKAGNLPQLFAL